MPQGEVCAGCEAAAATCKLPQSVDHNTNSKSANGQRIAMGGGLAMGENPGQASRPFIAAISSVEHPIFVFKPAGAPRSREWPWPQRDPLHQQRFCTIGRSRQM